MIGSATDLGFMDFIVNLAPVIVLIYVVTLFLLKLIYRKQLVTTPALQQSIMELKENDIIKNYPLLHKSLLVLSLTIIGFILHQWIHVESSAIALCLSLIHI